MMKDPFRDIIEGVEAFLFSPAKSLYMCSMALFKLFEFLDNQYLAKPGTPLKDWQNQGAPPSSTNGQILAIHRFVWPQGGDFDDRTQSHSALKSFYTINMLIVM